jgi:hypothetical protein
MLLGEFELPTGDAAGTVYIPETAVAAEGVDSWTDTKAPAAKVTAARRDAHCVTAALYLIITVWSSG